MAYRLKSTGIAANCTMCIAVDPDTGTIKDFASSTVTTDLAIGANVTISTQAWDGNTRHYFRPGSGTTDADFVKFGTNKPLFDMGVSATHRTVVFIGEVAGPAARVFGNSSADYFAAQNTGSGGATFPHAVIASNNYGDTNAALSSGNKRIFGWSLVRGGAANSSFIYSAADDAASGTVTTKTVGSHNTSYSLTYVNRRNDSTTHQQDKTHAILIFNTALTEAQFDSLRDDWFGTLLELASSGSTLTASSGSYSITGQAASLLAARRLTAESGTYSLSGQAATLTYTQPGVYVMQAGHGTYTITGSDALGDYAMRAEYGTYTLSGRGARLVWSGEPEPASGSWRRGLRSGRNRRNNGTHTKR